MPKRDDRKEVIDYVKALAKHVQSHAECKRRFGRNWEIKCYNGVVLNVATPRPRCTQIEASYYLGNEKNKSATLNIRSVKFRDPPPNPPPNVEPIAATTDATPVATASPNPPPNVKPIAATPAAAPAAAAAVHTTNDAPYYPDSPADSAM